MLKIDIHKNVTLNGNAEQTRVLSKVADILMQQDRRFQRALEENGTVKLSFRHERDNSECVFRTKAPKFLADGFIREIGGVVLRDSDIVHHHEIGDTRILLITFAEDVGYIAEFRVDSTLAELDNPSGVKTAAEIIKSATEQIKDAFIDLFIRGPGTFGNPDGMALGVYELLHGNVIRYQDTSLIPHDGWWNSSASVPLRAAMDLVNDLHTVLNSGEYVMQGEFLGFSVDVVKETSPIKGFAHSRLAKFVPTVTPIFSSPASDISEITAKTIDSVGKLVEEAIKGMVEFINKNGLGVDVVVNPGPGRYMVLENNTIQFAENGKGPYWFLNIPQFWDRPASLPLRTALARVNDLCALIKTSSTTGNNQFVGFEVEITSVSYADPSLGVPPKTSLISRVWPLARTADTVHQYTF